ncbi:MAG TPA: hypothetical protein VEK33_19105 [Terriglobales bacterium]|nr:hypothetical protein [Terriglobales bacterium]
MKRILVVLALVFCSAISGPLLAEDNPFVGTWKLNTPKSKFEPAPGPKSVTRTIVAQGTGANYSFEGVGPDGASFAYSFSTNYDGKDSAITGTGSPGGADAIALKRVGSRRVEGTLKKDGKELGKVIAEVSKDGKVSTVRTKGKTADGKELSAETVYDRQ